MPIFRWIIICLAVWVAVVIIRQLIDRRRKSISSHTPNTPSYSDMVACHYCNVHVPRAEALHENGRYYCSNDCSNKHRNDENNKH